MKFLSLYLISILFLASTRAESPERETLLKELKKPENVQSFTYTEFGPERLTSITLKEAGILGKKPAEVKVLVFVGGELETQYLLMLDEGELDKNTDYRLLWFPNAINLLDNVLKEKELSPTDRKTVTATRERISKTMGTHEEMLKRYKALKKPIKTVALKTGRDREKEFRQKLQAAQSEYLKKQSGR